MTSNLRISILLLSLFIFSCTTATPNLNIVNDETRMSLTQAAPISRGADISPDGKYLLTGGMKGFAYWDISKGVLINTYPPEGGASEASIVPVAFNSNGKYALAGGKELKLWDLSSGKVIGKFGSKPAAIIGVSSDGSMVLTCDQSDWSFWEDKMSVYDVQSGKKIAEWEAGSSGGIIALSPDGKYVLSSEGGGRASLKEERGVIYLRDTLSGRVVRTFEGTGGNKGFGQAVLSIVFSQDGKYVLSGGTDGSIRLWDIASGMELKTIHGHTGGIGTKAVAFSPNGRLIVSVGGSDGLAKLWDIASGSLIREFKVSDDRLVEMRRMMAGIINGWVSFTPDSRRIIFMGSDASFRIFDVGTGEEVATLVLFNNGEWLVVTPEGYYSASAKGAQYLKVNYEGKNYSVDQFYDVFYRPDIVAAKLSGQNISGLISITMKDASMNPPPLVEVTAGPSGTDRSKIKICYKVKSTGGGIGEVRLFHNGKLIQSDGYYKEIARSSFDQPQLALLNSRAIYDDMRGITLKDKEKAVWVPPASKGDEVSDCMEMDAVPGENEISISAFNSSNTVQSYIKTVRFNSKLKPADNCLYILAVGIDRYQDHNINLKYAVKDAKDMEKKLKEQAATLYKASNIHYTLMTDNEVTKSSINRKISELSGLIKPQDSFILFVAGHGVLLQNQYYILTHEFNGKIDNNSMISSNEIVEISKKIKSLGQLFIFDTCHAGGVDYIVSGLYDARMSVLAKKMGLHIYASASDKQSALDGYMGNGLFTYTLLDGLSNNKEADINRDGVVTIVGLGEYSRKATMNISKNIGRSQTPLIINFGKDIPIYKLP